MIDLAPLFGPQPPVAPATSISVNFRVFPRGNSARWMLEHSERLPWHLKTWPRANLRARAIYRAAWALGAVGVHLPSRVSQIAVSPDSLYAQLRPEFNHIGVFLGTPGPNRKFVIYAGNGYRAVFLKTPQSALSADAIRREEVALLALASDKQLAPLTPRVERIAGQLAIESIELAGVRHAPIDMPEIIRICELLTRRSRSNLRLSYLRAQWKPPSSGGRGPVRAEVADALKAADAFLNALDPDMEVNCYLAHGDFTRWNVLRAADGSARIIDWELYGLRPRHFDLLHYVVSHSLLVAKRSADDIQVRLDALRQELDIPAEEWTLDCGLYFAWQVLYYGQSYSFDEISSDFWQGRRQLSVWSTILSKLTHRLPANGMNK